MLLPGRLFPGMVHRYLIRVSWPFGFRLKRFTRSQKSSNDWFLIVGRMNSKKRSHQLIRNSSSLFENSYSVYRTVLFIFFFAIWFTTNSYRRSNPLASSDYTHVYKRCSTHTNRLVLNGLYHSLIQISERSVREYSSIKHPYYTKLISHPFFYYLHSLLRFSANRIGWLQGKIWKFRTVHKWKLDKSNIVQIWVLQSQLKFSFQLLNGV